MLKLWRGASTSNQPPTQEIAPSASAPAATPIPVEVPADRHDEGPGSEEAKPVAATEDMPAPGMVESEHPTSGKVPGPPLGGVDPEPFPTSNTEDNEPTPSGGADVPPTEQVSEGTQTTPTPLSPIGRVRRLSLGALRNFAFFYGRSTTSISPPAPEGEDSEETVETEAGHAATTAPPEASAPVSEGFAATPTSDKGKKKAEGPKAKRPTRSDRKAFSYALLLRSIIIGTPFSASGKSKPPPMKKLKSELLKPKEANRVIAEVRSLPTPDTSKGVLHGTLRGLNGKIEEKDINVVPSGRMPIHAVCLDCTDEEADQLHFNRLTSSFGAGKTGTTAHITLTPEVARSEPIPGSSSTSSFPNVASADLTSIIPVLRTLRLVDLVSHSIELIGTPANDFGFGQPVDSERGGILAGAVPSSTGLAQSMLEIGQEFLSLGFATSAAVVPNHAGVYPPKDRLSVLSYWWGYEVVIPPASMKYLGTVKSIQTAVLNFLTAFSLVNNGVREVLPFVRYVSQFIDFEWNAIKAQDKGKGVVCAATWVMPAALVPRPWDFAEPPPGAKTLVASASTAAGRSVIVDASVSAAPGSPKTPMVTLSPPDVLDVRSELTKG